MGLGWCFSSLLRVPQEPFCSPGMLPSRCPSHGFSATTSFPRSIFSVTSWLWLAELSGSHLASPFPRPQADVLPVCWH